MGSCATCVNPERSILKYRVSRLDQKSNVKEKLSESAVVQRDKHVYGNMSP